MEHGEGSRAIVTLEQIGMSAILDDSTGELLGARLALLPDFVVEYGFEGRLPAPVFPARHPGMGWTKITHANEATYGDVHEYSIAKVVSDLPEATYQWQSVAMSAKNAVTGKIVDRAGQPVEAVERSQSRDPPRLDSNNSVVVSSPKWTPGRIAMITGISMGFGVLVWMVRRRFAS